MTRFYEEAQQARRQRRPRKGFLNGFRATLECLNSAGVDFIIVGEVAAILRRSARFQIQPNLERLVLAPRPYLRGAPPGSPFLWDAVSLERGLNVTLTTQLGDLDLLGEVAPIKTCCR